MAHHLRGDRMATRNVTAVKAAPERRIKNASRVAVLQHAANELVFGLVGHVGSGTSTVAATLCELLKSPALGGGSYDTVILSAREEIENWANQTSRPVPQTDRLQLETDVGYQDLGDDMRLSNQDNSVVASALIKKVRSTRAKSMGLTADVGGAVVPNGKRRAYILESLRHPDEVELLRHIYQDAFILIGTVCDFEKRVDRITQKYKNAGRIDAIGFMKRDAKSGNKHGQRVSDTFHLADFFVNNSADRVTKDGHGNRNWHVSEDLSRLLKIISRNQVVRPEISETAMHDAYSASLRSACLSRQVGAALVDAKGNLIATGTNEVPKAGGGVYGEQFSQPWDVKDEPQSHEHKIGDHRCAYRQINGAQPYCSNTTEQNRIVKKLIGEIPELNNASAERQIVLPMEIKSGGIGDLLEFSRAVHAEMDALLSASRTGSSTVATRLFVTTYPCHY